ncbi:MAG: DUF3575 domain-containing protein [Crocinitomicaceae bacterium]|nr:DUF3575 domain-containing protein [Crocinitomicaceae bacterium]
MKKTILTTITALLVVVSSGIAQQEIVVIEQSNRSRRAKKPIRLNDNTSVIKFTPTQLLAGEINFSFEKQLSKQTSFEIGAGPTISNISLGDGGGNHYVDPIYGTYSYQTSKLGFFAEAGYRFYPLDETEALNRFYLSPTLKFKLMNFGIDDASQILDPRDGSDLRMNFAFNIGYQLWMSKSFSMDFFTGLGIGYQQMKTYNAVSTYNGNTNTYETEWLDNSYTQARYVFNFGVKVGIGHGRNN